MRRTRLPGPIQNNLATGNLSELVRDGVSRWISVDVNDGTFTKVASGDMGGEGTNVVGDIVTSTSGMRIIQDINKDGKAWNQNSHTADRWYRELKVDGRRLTWADIFSIEFLIARNQQGDQDRAGITIGLCDTATVTGTSNQQWIGLQGYNRNNAAGMDMRVGSGAGNGEVSDADGKKCYAIFTPAFDDDNSADTNVMMRRGVGLLLNNVNEVLTATGMGDNAEKFISTDPVYLFFSPCFRNSPVSQTSNTDDTWKVWYRVSFSDDNTSPDYVPGGGTSI